MIYLKTIFSAPNEVKFIKLNLLESWDIVDKVVVCEYNKTHTGLSKPYYFENYLDTFTEEQKNRILYLKFDLSGITKESVTDHDIIHLNEKYMRGYFVEGLDLKNNDIVFSVDADEIIFRRFYPKIINSFSFFRKAFKLNLHQFYYKPNYLWIDKDFIAPTVCKGSYYHKFPSQWRYDGKLFLGRTGAHFSWQLTVDEMLEKLKNYGHAHNYGHLAQREILEDAVKNKKYPFNEKEDFRIRVLDFDKDAEYYPETFKQILNDFSYLL
jgi:hypothetical protein